MLKQANEQRYIVFAHNLVESQKKQSCSFFDHFCSQTRIRGVLDYLLQHTNNTTHHYNPKTTLFLAKTTTFTTTKKNIKILNNLHHLFFWIQKGLPSKKDEKPVVPPSLADQSAHLTGIKTYMFEYLSLVTMRRSPKPTA